MPVFVCGCGAGLQQFLQQARVAAEGAATSAQAVGGEPTPAEVSAIMNSSGQITTSDDANSSQNHMPAVDAFYFQSEPIIIKMKHYRWGTRMYPNVSCTRCSAHWRLLYDKRSSGSVDSVEIVDVPGDGTNVDLAQ